MVKQLEGTALGWATVTLLVIRSGPTGETAKVAPAELNLRDGTAIGINAKVRPELVGAATWALK